MTDPIVIVSAVRTPMGGFQGDLKGLTAPQLGAAAIRAAVERAGIDADPVRPQIHLIGNGMTVNDELAMIVAAV